MLFSLMTVAIALPAGRAAAEPTPSATTVAWELSFQPAPLMKISVDTGSGSTTYWYMLYTVTNNTGQDIDFHPEIVRVSEMENETPADKAAAQPDTAPTIKAEPAIVGIDAREGKVALRGWEKLSNIDAVDFAQKVAGMGIERIVYTDIARDGMLSGINLDATREIAEASGLKVTASGGVASLDDIYALRELEPYGVDSVIVGKALYEGVFTLEDALDAAESDADLED